MQRCWTCYTHKKQRLRITVEITYTSHVCRSYNQSLFVLTYIYQDQIHMQHRRSDDEWHSDIRPDCLAHTVRGQVV